MDEYIDQFPDPVRQILSKVRQVIHDSAPTAVESIAYGMPAYKLNKKRLVYFAGYEKHIGFYATPTGHAKFEPSLSQYKQGKGSVQFPINGPIPYDLIRDIVLFRISENLQTSIQ